MARSRRPLSLLLPLLPPRSIIVDRDPRGPLHSPQILHDSSSSRSSSSSSSSSSRGGGRAVKGMAPPLRDPGDWIFSPEWWGIQGRGWGRDEGSTLFRHTSHRSNGIVTVTSHPASSSGLEDWPEAAGVLRERPEVSVSCEWRVLRFNSETRQSVAKVLVLQDQNAGEPLLMQIPDCLAFDCLKSMISVGLASVNCGGLDLEYVARGMKQMRCLCIGLGGGSLPLFLANKLQGCNVDVIEIDKTVISAATGFMGFPKYAFKASKRDDNTSLGENIFGGSNICGLFWGNMPDKINGIEADGVSYINDLQNSILSSPNYYDIVFIDAFDGNDQVPSCFWSEDGSFLSDLYNLLHPSHGTVVMNLHTDAPPPSLVERMRGEVGPGFDPLLPGGKQLLKISRLYRNSLLGDKVGHVGGTAFTNVVPRQQNICLTIARGIEGPTALVADCLKKAACRLEHVLRIPFEMSTRILRGFHFVN